MLPAGPRGSCRAPPGACAGPALVATPVSPSEKAPLSRRRAGASQPPAGAGGECGGPAGKEPAVAGAQAVDAGPPIRIEPLHAPAAVQHERPLAGVERG